jgi:hypothetical protein
MGHNNNTFVLGTSSKENTETLPSSSTSTSKSASSFTLRLHLIRHGETISNKNHLVLGQTDSVRFST